MASSKQRTILISGYEKHLKVTSIENSDTDTGNSDSCTEGGAGNALALAFAAAGLRVFATARSLKSMKNLQNQKNIETFTLDVTSQDSINNIKAEISNLTGGTLDILYNNAGALYESPAIEADSDRVRKMFDANVFGLFDMVTAFTPLLLAAVPNSSTPPTIVNVASVLARLPGPFTSGYNASKAAVASYSDTLRLEVSPLGLKVLTVYMGEVSTAIIQADNVKFAPDSVYADTEAKIRERSATHEKTTMKPEEFARQVVPEVLSAKSPYVWKGTNAFIVWLLNAFGPRTVFDSTMNGASGLSDQTIRKKIFQRGQDKLKTA
ncbi:Short-chain dehydrogenase cctT [Colletotrichum gloeosporioides]|uniref:Short-chain dehydrogenase cctT n=1 Tax=Colletotrichum gloeosporioides TaxID=474922 RepID=A0A8H4C955_COLGL|nr:Short-chain dehydrogenase cctT [Colletotrichum gloeosporioides]KAF3799493.1 Short-chain dehydrogenase cctT [Colletotrichum gloeosporioides]